MVEPGIAMPVTLTFIALCCAALFVMTGWVGLRRGPLGALRGDGGDDTLYKRIRIHGNFAENAPLAALALGGAEWLGLAPHWLWLAVASFILGRILHLALFDNKLRGIAMTMTQGPGLVLGIWTMLQVWG